MHAVPSIHAVRKTLKHPSLVDAAIMRAAQACCGSPILQPVYLPGAGRVAYVRGRNWRDPRVDVWPLPEKHWAGFSTYDDLISELTAGKKYTANFSKAATTNPVANNWYHLWTVAGIPGAGAYGGTARTAKRYDDTSTGAILHGGNVSADTKHLLSTAQLSTAGATSPLLWLCDLVLSYEQCAFSAAVNQAMTNTLTALRYNGAGLSGMQACVVADAVLGATAANMTRLAYTDNAGNTANLMPTGVTKAITVSAAAPTASLGSRCVVPLGNSPWIELAAGDQGMRAIEDYTTSAANTGTMAMLLLKPLAVMPTYTAGIMTVLDTVAQVASLERIYDGACLTFLAFYPAATGNTFFGRVEVGWG
jgi:hypothetical protein